MVTFDANVDNNYIIVGLYTIETLGCKKPIDTAYVLFFVAMCLDCFEG